MANNVILIGAAKREQYTNAILSYTDPENLRIFTPKDVQTEEMKNGVEDIGFELNTMTEDDTSCITKIILFTNFIGLDAVRLFEEAVSAKTEIILIPT